MVDRDAAVDADRIADLEAECEQLRKRLHDSDERGRSRSELLYALQSQYASEHFALQESMRNLKIERMRNAGMFAERDIVISRAGKMQARIRSLKRRLGAHEAVEDEHFDDAPIVIDNAAPDRGGAAGT
ncbi:MAG TPA: hypothetical protein VHX17_13520 [Candidatus Cybelea sp.]|jgi:hypothetical protein|nr:hypothetical protein [Candidatus Cybelea sp.]